MPLLPVSLKLFVVKVSIMAALFLPHFLVTVFRAMQHSWRSSQDFSELIAIRGKEITSNSIWCHARKEFKIFGEITFFYFGKVFVFSGSYVGHNKYTSITIKRYNISGFIITQLCGIKEYQFLMELQLFFHTWIFSFIHKEGCMILQRRF